MSTCPLNGLQRNAGDSSACQDSSGTDQKSSGKTQCNLFSSVDDWTLVGGFVSIQMGQQIN